MPESYEPVEQYVRLTDDIRRMQKNKDDFSGKYADREKLKPAMTKALTKELRETFSELIGTDPGVDFRLEKMPCWLTVSRRDRAEIVEWKYVGYAGDAEKRRIESAWGKKGDSALVWEVTGLSTTPISLDENTSYSNTLVALGHEGAHHYFSSKPLGKGYGSSRECATINETSSNIIGDSIRERILSELPEDAFLKNKAYGEMQKHDAVSGRIKKTAKKAEKLLSEGKIDAAERLMNEEQGLLETEYGIRELKDYGVRDLRHFNQAYIATMKRYGEDKTESITRDLESLMHKCSDVRDFAKTVAQTTSYSQVKDALRQKGGG